MAAEMLEQLDLTQSPLGEDLLAEHIGDFFDGDALAGLNVGRGTVEDVVSPRDPKQWLRADLPHDTVCALTQLLGDIVVFIHDEVLVEDLEHLATLQLSHGAGISREGGREEEEGRDEEDG